MAHAPSLIKFLVMLSPIRVAKVCQIAFDGEVQKCAFSPKLDSGLDTVSKIIGMVMNVRMIPTHTAVSKGCSNINMSLN